MLLLSILLALLVVIFFAFYLQRAKGKIRGKPLPGPPIIESLQVFLRGAAKNTLHLDVTKYANRYGPIVQFRLLLNNLVVVNDADLYRRLSLEPLAAKCTNDKPPNFLHSYIHKESLIFEKNSPKHSYKKKIFYKVLKFYGEGVAKFESLMTETLQDLSEILKKKKEVEIGEMVRDYISSIIVVLLTGVKSSSTIENVRKIKNWSGCIDAIFLFENEMFLQNFPFLRHIPGLRFKTLSENVSRSKKEFFDTFIKPVDASQETGGDYGKGIVQELLEERKKQGSKFEITDVDVEAMSLDIVAGAYLSTSSNLCSLFLQLAKHPEMQKKIYDEIMQVIGNEKPSFSHRKDMHYTEAVILETLRYFSTILFLYHYIREDFEFDGYHIPGGSIFLVNVWYNNHKPLFGDDPWVFKPERFLNEKGELVDLSHPIREKLLAFGSGPRKCPGETFAKSRLFLIVTTLVKQFEILPSEEKELPSSDPRKWADLFLLQPGPFKCQFVPRCNE